jgi:hypothetical protein
MFHTRLVIDKVMGFKILPSSWKLVLMFTGREVKLQEAEGSLKSIDQNGRKNLLGIKWIN